MCFFSLFFLNKNLYTVFLQLCCDFWGYNRVESWTAVCFLMITGNYLLLPEKPLITRKCTSVQANILLRDIMEASGFVRLKGGLDIYENKNSICSYANEDRRWCSPVVVFLGISCSPVEVRKTCLSAMFKCWPVLWMWVCEFKVSEVGWFQSSYQKIQQKLTVCCTFRVTLLFFVIMLHAASRYL